MGESSAIGMRHSRLRSRLRALRALPERGAQLIEFALVLPILMSFMFGIVTGGIAFSHKLSMDNSARETARYAATLPVDGDLPGWLANVADVAIEAGTGSLDAGEAGRQLCVAYVYPEGTLPHDKTTRVVEDANGARLFSTQPCVADGRPNDERRVQVVLQRDSDLLVFYFSRTLTLTSQSVGRFERGQS